MELATKEQVSSLTEKVNAVLDGTTELVKRVGNILKTLQDMELKNRAGKFTGAPGPEVNAKREV